MLHALKVWNCLNFVRKRLFFCLIKLLFIKVRCLMLMLALWLILKDKGGKQHSLPFVGSNLGVEIFLKKREHQKRMRWNRGLRHVCILCIEVSKKLYSKSLSAYKGILKVLFSFIPWLLNFSDLLNNYGSKLRKRYTLRLLSKCLGKRTPSPYWG